MDSQAQPSAQELVLAAVNVARSAGLSWEAIGDILGVDAQTASRQYTSLSWTTDAASQA